MSIQTQTIIYALTHEATPNGVYAVYSGITHQWVKTGGLIAIVSYLVMIGIDNIPQRLVEATPLDHSLYLEDCQFNH